jgi:hypothetical protein
MRIGVTGHQSIPLPVQSWIRDAVSEYLENATTELIGVSSLAIGADQIFAEEVVKRKGALYAVIPSREYGTTFKRPFERRRYEALLSQSLTVETLDFLAPSEDAFYAAGKRVVELSDQLVAVWDGKPARGKGGTADIVAFAKSTGMHVEIIWPQNANR